ncbi:MAG: hypothetical protein AAFR77_14890 [Cyanobacteria bacterium J06631_2]
MSIYSAYGLTIKSDLLLPELRSGNKEDTIDLYIKQGSIPLPKLQPTPIQRQGVTACFGGDAKRPYLHWSGVATFYVPSKNTLIVQPEKADIEPELLNLYILSEALGLILYQQGYLLLHGSAIKVKGKVVVFAGAAGAGKSTTAAAFARLGYPILGDDMVAMKLAPGGKVMVYPGYPQVKVWSPTVQGLNLQGENLAVLFPGSKKQLLRPRKFLTEPCVLAHCFILSSGDRLHLSPLKGQQALMSFMKYFPCPGQMLEGGAWENYNRQCLQLMKLIPLWQLQRPNDFKILKKFVVWLIRKMAREESPKH